MSNEHCELVAERFFYVPWHEDERNLLNGVALARQLAADSHRPLLVAVTCTSQVPVMLEHEQYVTEVTASRDAEPHVVALLHPTRTLLERVLAEGDGDYVVGVESADYSLAEWARANNAFNIDSGRVEVEVYAS